MAKPARQVSPFRIGAHTVEAGDVALRGQIRQFIRQSLQCRCPDEVFQHIDYEYRPVADEQRPFNLRLRVGGRLLVYVLRTDDSDDLERVLPTVFAVGRQDRDRSGLNRFRAVLVARDPQITRARAERAYQQCDTGDQTSHLHVIGRAELDGL